MILKCRRRYDAVRCLPEHAAAMYDLSFHTAYYVEKCHKPAFTFVANFDARSTANVCGLPHPIALRLNLDVDDFLQRCTTMVNAMNLQMGANLELAADSLGQWEYFERHYHSYERPRLLEFIIWLGVDVRGSSLFRYAVKNNTLDCMDYLLAAGAEVSPPAPGCPPLHYSGLRRWTVQRLISLGADVNGWHRSGSDRETTPLIAASSSTDAIEALLDAGADINAVGSNGNTALLEAASAISPAAALLLIRRGADVKAGSRDGENALHRLKRRAQHDRGWNAVFVEAVFVEW